MFEVSDPPTYSGDRVHSNQNQHLVNKIMSSPISYDLQGQGGGVVLNGGDTATNVRWVQCLTNCVFTTFTASNLTNSSDIATITIPAGVGIGGKIETVTLTSGLAIAYSK